MTEPRRPALPPWLETELASIHARGNDPSLIEQLCARHPEHATALRQVAALANDILGTLSAPADLGTSPVGDRVQSTATGELLRKLAVAPKLDEARYTLETEIGKGGMGVVMRIHDQHLNRRLAMKVLLERGEPRDDEERRLVHQLLGRFLEEAQVTSQLDHPGVVPVHELGLDQRGKVYFTMRLVKGRTANEVFADAREETNDWTTTRALEVILKVCDTMAYAHDKGVLHRDLKPANVMVGRFGEVYVMDWGLAKVLGQSDRHDLRIATQPGTGASVLATARQRDSEGETGSSVVSMDGQQLGTPSYMAPEQARSEELDQRADVYSIGAMIYELLTGRAPYTVPGARQPAYRVLNDVVDGPPKRIEDLQKGVPAELVAIVERAMARERGDRYANVLDLAADLRAFLAQRVVRAYRTGALVEIHLWVRRNRGLAAAVAVAALTLVAGTLGTLSFARQAEARAQQVSQLSSQQAGQLKEASWSAFHRADRLLSTFARDTGPSFGAGSREGLLLLAQALTFDPTNEVAWQRFAAEAAARGENGLLAIPELSLPHDDPVSLAKFSPDGALVATTSGGSARLWDASSGRLLRELPHQSEVADLSFSPDGSHLLTASGHTVQLWETASGRPLAAMELGGKVDEVAFAPRGQHVSLLGKHASGRSTMWVVDAALRMRCFERQGKRSLWGATWSPDGRLLAVSEWLRGTQVYDVPKGDELASIEDWGLDATFSPDGKQIVVANIAGSTTIRDAATGRTLTTLDGLADNISRVAFSPDGIRLLTTKERTARSWDTKTGTLLRSLEHPAKVDDITFSPDGELVVTSCADGVTRVWRIVSGELIRLLGGTTTKRPLFSPNGTRLLATSGDRACVWSLAAGHRSLALVPADSRSDVKVAAFSPDGERVLTSITGPLTAWDSRTGRPLFQVHHDVRVDDALFDLSGARFVTRSFFDPIARVWDGKNGALLLSLKDSDVITSVAFRPDGALILTTTKRSASLWSADRGEKVAGLETDAEVIATAFSSDGSLIVLGHATGAAVVWDSALAQRRQSCDHGSPMDQVLFSPDGTRLLTCGATTKLWDVASGACLHTNEELTHKPSRFHPDGTLFGTPSGRKVQVRRATTGELLRELQHEDDIGDVAFAADGALLITACVDGTARVWDMATGVVVMRVLHESAIVAASFDADGSRVLTAAKDGSCKVTSLAVVRELGSAHSPEEVGQAVAIAESLAGQFVSPDGRLLPLPPARARANRDEIGRLQQGTSSLAAFARWVGAQSHASPAFLGAKITCRERADYLLGIDIWARRRAYMLCPDHPLVHLAMAPGAELLEANPSESDWLRADAREAFLLDYGIRRLPPEAPLLARAAQLVLPRHKERALAAAQRALALDPANEVALQVQAEANR